MFCNLKEIGTCPNSTQMMLNLSLSDFTFVVWAGLLTFFMYFIHFDCLMLLPLALAALNQCGLLNLTRVLSCSDSLFACVTGESKRVQSRGSLNVHDCSVQLNSVISHCWQIKGCLCRMSLQGHIYYQNALH